MIDRGSAVTFENPKGCRLFGILHTPDQSRRRDIGIVLLSPGIKNRVAPHRLYNKMATALASRGFAVLRFDFFGLGDSEGELQEEQLADVYRAIQLGRYSEDTTAALDWMQRTLGLQRFIVGGLCGGAISALLLAQTEPRIAGLLALGLPVIVDGASADQQRFMTVGQLESIRGGYVSKLLSVQAWLRLLSLKSDFRLIARSFGVGRGSPRTSSSAAEAGHPSWPSNLNPLFAPAFERLLAGSRPALLIFSGSDRLCWEFHEKYADHHSATIDRYRRLIDLHVVPDANHVFSFQQWQDEMMDHVNTWLEVRFGAAAETRAVAEAATA